MNSYNDRPSTSSRCCVRTASVQTHAKSRRGRFPNGSRAGSPPACMINLYGAVSPDVLHPLFRVRARQTTQREQPRHKPKFGFAFAGLDELIHLAQRGEVVPSLRRHCPPAPLEAR